MGDDVPAVAATSNVTRALTLRLFGSKRLPVLVIAAAFMIGMIAGFSEELAFRGVLQAGLVTTMNSAAAIFVSSVIFGVLHAATPLYAVIAGLFSAYFGWLFNSTDNLTVPITTHAVYDWVQLVGTHWVVTEMPRSQRLALLGSVGISPQEMTAAKADNQADGEGDSEPKQGV